MANVTVAGSGVNPDIEGGNRTVVRTSGNRVYVLTTTNTTTPGLVMYKGDQVGDPTSFSIGGVLSSLTGLQEIGAACIIDSNDFIHCIYYQVDTNHGGVLALRYVIFNTSLNIFLTPETVSTLDNDGNTTYDRLAISIDSDNIPQVIWKDSSTSMSVTTYTTWYSNKIGGSWNSRIAVISGTQVHNVLGDLNDMMVAVPMSSIGSDRPIILLASPGSGGTAIYCRYGDALNATSWVNATVHTGSSGWGIEGKCSFAIDENDTIHIVYVRSTYGGLYVRRHLTGSAWTTWETFEIVDDTDDYAAPSIAISGSDVIIAAVSNTDNDIHAFRNSATTSEPGDITFGPSGIFETIEKFAFYVSQANMDTWWVPNDTAKGRGNFSTQVLDFTAVRDDSNDHIYQDIGTKSNTSWVLRFKLNIVTLSPGGTTDVPCLIGLSSLNTGPGAAQDSIMFNLVVNNNGNKFRTSTSDNSGLVITGTNFTTTPATGIYYVELKRTSSTSATLSLYSDSAYSSLIESKTFTVSVNCVSLRYMTVTNYVAIASGSSTITVDNIEFWNAQTTVGSQAGFEEISAGDLPNVGTFNDVKLKWRSNQWQTIWSGYFDAHTQIIDNNGDWINDANAFDGSQATAANSGNANGQVDSLEGHGTNAPASGGTIEKVRWRHKSDHGGSALFSVRIYADGQGETLYSCNNCEDSNGGLSAWKTLTPPSGGWTWAKLQELEIEFWPNSGSGNIWYTTEIEALGFGTDSTDIDYVFEDSSGNVLYNIYSLVTTTPVNQIWNLRHDMVGIVNRQWALRHDISSFINRTWNLRHDVFTTVNRIWDIRHDLSQFVNRTWNLRHDLDGIVNRVWNIRHDISQFVNQTWNIRSDISQFVARNWNLRHDVSQFVNRIWILRHDISQFVNQTWNLRSDVSSFVNRIWNIRYDLSSLVNQQWNLRHDLSSLINRVWNLRHDVASSLTPVNRTWNLRHDLSILVSRSWNLRHDLSSFVAQIWNIRQDISQFVNRQWDIRHDLSEFVAQQWNLRHDIATLVAQTWNLRHDLAGIVNRIWNVRHDISSFVNQNWNIRHDILTLVNRVWSLRHDLSSFVNQTWNLRHDLNQFVNRIWNVRHDLSILVNNSWNLRQDISQFVVGLWNLRHDVSEFVARSWNIRHDLAGIVGNQWNIRHDILSLIGRTWNLRHDLLILVSQNWNLRHDLVEFVSRVWNLRHDLAGTVNQVWNIRHDISVLLARAWTLRHDLSVLVNQGWDLRHDIAQFVSQTWNLRNDLAGAVSRLWNMRHDVISFVNQTWNLRSDILTLVNNTWNIRHDIIQFTSRIWNLRHDLAGTVSETWNLRHDLAHLVAQAWNLRYDLSTFVSGVWNLRHDLLTLVGRTWNLRQDLVSFVNNVWNVRHDISSFINQTWNIRQDISIFVQNSWNLRHDITNLVQNAWNFRHDITSFVSRIWVLRHDISANVTKKTKTIFRSLPKRETLVRGSKKLTSISKRLR